MQTPHLDGTASASAMIMRPRPQRRLLDQLRARGIRLTSQRAALVNILDAEDGFVDVATLCAMARRKGARVDRATVYRTLAMLRANDLLSPSGDGRTAPDGSPAPPVTKDDLALVCECCGVRQPLVAEAPASIKRELHRSTGFDARAVRLEARGECRLCAARNRLRSRTKD